MPCCALEEEPWGRFPRDSSCQQGNQQNLIAALTAGACVCVEGLSLSVCVCVYVCGV
jgi:hypothetical protein